VNERVLRIGRRIVKAERTLSPLTRREVHEAAVNVTRASMWKGQRGLRLCNVSIAPGSAYRATYGALPSCQELLRIGEVRRPRKRYRMILPPGFRGSDATSSMATGRAWRGRWSAHSDSSAASIPALAPAAGTT
jgi:hypothetical protein